MLSTIVCVSTAWQEMGQDDLEQLLHESRENNARLNVTGMMIDLEGNFIQVLEGEKEVIDKLYRTICQDNGNRSNTQLFRGGIKERSFSKWSMAFQRVSVNDLQRLDGFQELGGRNIFEFIKNENIAVGLIKAFYGVNFLEKFGLSGHP